MKENKKLSKKKKKKKSSLLTNIWDPKTRSLLNKPPLKRKLTKNF